MTINLIILAATLLVGVLIGCTLSERALKARSTRQAAVQRTLNNQWQKLAAEWHELTLQWDELEAAEQEFAQRQGDELRQPVR